VWDDPKFVEHIHFEKVDFVPITANAILHAQSKQTDLINANASMGFSSKLLISGKLKKIIENYRKSGMQFFNSPVIQNNIFVEDYWILNMFEFNNEYIDFSKSEVIQNKKSEDYNVSYKTFKEKLYFENFEQFNRKRKEVWSVRQESISIEKLNLHLEKINEDFFSLQFVFGQLYFVSETLKQEIGDAGCTGIEFQPVELSYNEWTAPGGEREKIYGKT
jgi:hypothetical protein